MTPDECNALLLAARLLESGIDVAHPHAAVRVGHVGVALALAGRLRRVADDPEQARQVIEALRSAARGPGGGVPA